MEVDQPKPALQPDSSPGMPQTVAASGKGGEGIASRLWTLFREVSFYGVGIVLARSLSLLVTPVLTRLFSPSDFGLLDLLQTVGALAMLVIFRSVTSRRHRIQIPNEEDAAPDLERELELELDLDLDLDLESDAEADLGPATPENR